MLHFVGFSSAANTGCSGFAYAMARWFAVAGWLAPWRTGMRHGCITLVCIIYDKCTISKQQSQYVKFLCVDNCFLEMITQFFFIYLHLFTKSSTVHLHNIFTTGKTFLQGHVHMNTPNYRIGPNVTHLPPTKLMFSVYHNL